MRWTSFRRKLPARKNEIVGLMLVLLLAAGLAISGRVTKTTLSQDKDFFAAISSAVSVTAIVAGGTFSYLRFFRGRTLSPRLVLSLTDTCIGLSNGYLHSLEIEIKNVGTMPIWDHSVQVFVQFHEDPTRGLQPVADFAQWPSDDDSVLHNVIDIGESAYEHAFYSASTNVQACTFRVMVTTPDNSRWSRCITVSNKMKAD